MVTVEGLATMFIKTVPCLQILYSCTYIILLQIYTDSKLTVSMTRTLVAQLMPLPEGKGDFKSKQYHICQAKTIQR